jgi:hypothetical protein
LPFFYFTMTSLSAISSVYRAEVNRRGRASGKTTFTGSDSFTPENMAVILSTFHRDMDQNIRQALLTDPANVLQYRCIWNNKLCFFTRPTLVVSPTGETAMIGTMTDDIGVAVPASIPVEQFYAWFTTLVSRADATTFNLPVALEAPDTLEGPLLADDAEGERAVPSMERLHCDGVEEPVIAAIPRFLPWGKGIPASPATLATVEGTGALVEHFPFYETWRKGHCYIVEHNGGTSLTQGGLLFDPTDISPQPFSHLNVMAHVENGFTMLPPTSSDYDKVCAIVADLEFQTYSQLVSYLPPQQELPEQPATAQPGGSFGLAEFAALANMTKQPVTTKKEEAEQVRIDDTMARYCLMFASLKYSDDPNSQDSSGNVDGC